MSTSKEKRSLAAAKADAEKFREMFANTFERWEFAGSLRRGKPEVSDVEHVVIPTIKDAMQGGLFAEPRNEFLNQSDLLVGAGKLAKHQYPNETFRWGAKYRGFDFNGFTHEVFCADDWNWGSVLAIRTGPDSFSRKMVTGLIRLGRRNHQGYVWCVEPCPNHQPPYRECKGDCEKCKGLGFIPQEKLKAGTEEDFFRLCGMEYVEPNRRLTEAK